MAACRLFDEDEVCLITPDKGYVYGLVLENAEFISSDEEGDELPGQITKGSVRVAWHPDGKETVVEEDKVMLADRSLMPGDVVRHLDDNEDSQAGFVEDMSVTCHLHVLGTDKYIYNVNSKDLIYPKYDTDPGDVTYGPWLGRIDAVNEEYVLQFPDGARCVINDNDICAFEDITDKRCKHTEFCNYETYPSQELKATMGDLGEVKWLVETPAYNATIVKSKPKMNIHVTVAEVRTFSVDVHWLCRGLAKVENPLDNTETPPRQVSGDDLNRLHSLNWFEHCSVQIGDKVQYVIPDTSVLVTTPPKHNAKPMNVSDIIEQSQNDCSQPGDPSPPEQASCDALGKPKTDCKCNDEECEGAEADSEDSSDAESLGSNRSDGSTKKRKNPRKGPHLATKSMRKVKGRRAKKKFNFPERKLQAGDTVTTEICYTFSKACIRWQDASQTTDVPSTKLYPIHHLDALEFFPGDFVSDTREEHQGDYGVVVNSNHKDRTCVVKWMRTYEVGKGNSPSCVLGPTEVSVYDIVDHLEYKYRTGYNVIRVGGFRSRDEELPAVGQVYSLANDGTIDVKWSNGRVTTCYPQDLYVSSDILEDFSDSELDSSDSSSDDDEEEEESDASWETEDEEDIMDPEGMFKDRDTVEKKGIPFLNEEQNADVKSLMSELPSDLANLETVFEFLNEGTPNLTSQYREILQIYSSCKYLDKTLKTSFFKDEDLIDLIAIIKSERKREKYKKISNRFQSLYLSWYNNVSSLGSEISPIISLSGDDGGCNPSGDQHHCTSLREQDGCAASKSDAVQSRKDDSDLTSPNRVPKSVTDEEGSLSTGDCCASGDQTDGACGIAQNISSLKLVGKKETRQTEAGPNSVQHDRSSRELCINVLRKLHDGVVKLQNEMNKYKTASQTESGTQTDMYISEIKVENGEDDSARLCGEATVKSENGDAAVKSENGDADKTELCQASAMKCEKATIAHCFLEQSSDCDKGNQTQDMTRTEVPIQTNELAECCPETDEHSKASADVSDKVEELVDGGMSVCHDIQSQLVDDNISRENGASCVVESQDCDRDSMVVKGFELVDEVLLCHRFYGNEHVSTAPKAFHTAVSRELKLLQTSLPSGILVKCFADRLDLFSIMIVGPKKTPYEDGLFFFDVQLPSDYPSSPPVFHYYSYCMDRLNPNLYDDGKVCVSLLGTWAGKDNEVWTAKSNLLQVLISIQGLILVSEPYYNEAGYEKQRGTTQAAENSRMYNEMAILKLIQSLTNMARKPPKVFEKETWKHLATFGPRIIKQLEAWMKVSDKKTKEETQSLSKPNDETSPNSINTAEHEHQNHVPGLTTNETKLPDDTNAPCVSTSDEEDKIAEPDFPLLPVSRGFRLTLKKQLAQFRKVLDEIEPVTV
ncbi:(E3-independent) E2 ubiquitin-conjugating enzyme UBE2O-like [Gigantopelta aegis]|uniref:(E3-independent) E2 ubiquitin-conjugating enzyme UBE2O-like n=1 Tax=Gigantopelta aegis TaxID=1735272 RepID=UPI001B88D589|nr:(E3-independent) E2 ubiquitin-conjugating enzyme UBE2O-like [Gigantopelta aegis]